MKYPKEGENVMQIRIPFVIYADFETINKSINSPIDDFTFTKHLVKFEACGYSYQVVCSNEKFTQSPVVYRGEDAADHFMKNLFREEAYVREILSQIETVNYVTGSRKSCKMLPTATYVGEGSTTN